MLPLLLLAPAFSGALAPALAATPGTPTHWQPARVSEASVMMTGGAGGCDVAISVGADGVPAAVQAESCMASLHDEVEEAAMQWRFEPLSSGAFTYRASVPVAPPALDLPLIQAGDALVVLEDPDTQPVVRKLKAPASSMALRRLLQERERRFAWELCRVEVLVGADGKVSQARPVECAELLWPSVEKAALKTRFDPAFKDGQAVAAVAALELVVTEMP